MPKNRQTLSCVGFSFSVMAKTINNRVLSMNRKQIKQHNRKVLKQVSELIKLKLKTPYRYKMRMGYKELAANLNKLNLLSSRGNCWTMRSLYRMMQRRNVALHTIQRQFNKGHLRTC